MMHLALAACIRSKKGWPLAIPSFIFDSGLANLQESLSKPKQYESDDAIDRQIGRFSERHR
jgi:hypothetical protein